ncbi:unnamed protein product [Laminaria digitata]
MGDRRRYCYLTACCCCTWFSCATPAGENKHEYVLLQHSKAP